MLEMIEAKTTERQLSWMWSAPKVYIILRIVHKQRGVNFGKIRKLIFELPYLSKIDYTQRDKQTHVCDRVHRQPPL